MSAPTLDSMTWSCACGLRPWRHYENCPDCGAARPEPPPEPPPSQFARPEPDPA